MEGEANGGAPSGRGVIGTCRRRGAFSRQCLGVVIAAALKGSELLGLPAIRVAAWEELTVRKCLVG